MGVSFNDVIEAMTVAAHGPRMSSWVSREGWLDEDQIHQVLRNRVCPGITRKSIRRLLNLMTQQRLIEPLPRSYSYYRIRSKYREDYEAFSRRGS